MTAFEARNGSLFARSVRAPIRLCSCVLATPILLSSSLPAPRDDLDFAISHNLSFPPQSLFSTPPWHRSVITGTQPGVLLPQDTSLPSNPVLGKHKQDDTFQSDLPKHISLKDLLDSVCYHNIELFYLKDPQSKHDVLCAIIKFHNLKG